MTLSALHQWKLAARKAHGAFQESQEVGGRDRAFVSQCGSSRHGWNLFLLLNDGESRVAGKDTTRRRSFKGLAAKRPDVSKGGKIKANDEQESGHTRLKENSGNKGGKIKGKVSKCVGVSGR